mmetsp:Transcript_22994/g.52127  ORF Transcript_22994/g.52127 Transcript_22994/m.52127 type:complete len:86 (-) Transcript_22994:628-885(-)
MSHYRVGNGHAVEGGGPAAKFIQDDEGAVGRMAQDLSSFFELDPKRRETGHDSVVGANAREDSIDGGEAARLRRNPTAEVRHQGG